MSFLINILSTGNRLRMKIRRFRRELYPRRQWLTLDIGSGDGPAVSADVLCDRFVGDDAERTAPLLIDRPFVIGDLTRLPFKDNAFDYVYCKHVLEHIPDPGAAIRELQRIARAGYVEMPSEYCERASRSGPAHLWFVRIEKGTFIFMPKEHGIVSEEINDKYYNLLMDKDPYYTAFYNAHYFDLFVIGREWLGSIPFKITAPVRMGGADGFVKATERPLSDREISAIESVIKEARHRFEKAGLKKKMKRLAKRLFRWYYAGGKEFNLNDLIVCPACRQSLKKDGSKLYCGRCGRAYPILDGAPCLLTEAARQPSI